MSVALTSLAACAMIGPDFTQPSAEVNTAWLEAESAKVAPQETVQKAWWTLFKDPVLDQLVDQAYADNPDLQTAGANVLQARALLGAAIGELYPQQQQLVGSLLYERTSLREPGAPVGGGASDQVTNLVDSFGAQANWEIDVWGRIRRNIQSADAQFLASIASYDNVLVSLTADVAAGYVSLRTLEAQLEILKKNVEVQQEALDLAQIQFRGGTTTELDVYQASTILTSTQAQVPNIEAQIQVARNTICALVGVPPGSLDELLNQGKGIPVAPAKVAVGIPAELLRRRPDVRQAELIAASQSELIGVELGALYPAFSLFGSFTFVSSNYFNSAAGANFELSDIFSWRARAIEFGPGVSWNILNYGQITNRVRAQDAAFQASLSNYESVVLSAQQEVESALIQYLNQFEVIDALRKSVEFRAEGVRSRLPAVQGRHRRFHHRAHRGAAADRAGKLLDDGPGPAAHQPGGDLPCPGRRLGDPRGQGLPAAADDRDDDEADELGRLAVRAGSGPGVAGRLRQPVAEAGMVARIMAARALWLALVLLVAACDDKENSYVPPPPPEVTVAKPARKDVTDYLFFTGNTDAIQTVTLVARVQGFLEKQHFQDGQTVKQGDLLFTIQRDTYKAQLDAANAQVAVVQAQLDHAQTEFTRYTGLAKRGAAPQTDVDQWRSSLEQAKANLLSAQAQVELSQLNYGYTLVTAPFDGRMGRRFVDPGNLVGAGDATKLAEINQIDPLYVYFTINERDLLRVTGQRQKSGSSSIDDLNSESIPLEMGLSTQEDFPFKGKYDFAALSVTPTTGTLLLRGVFPNPGGWIQPGLFARVRAPAGTIKDAILLPQDAIAFDQQGRYVLTVGEKNVVQRVSVEVGQTVGEDQVILSGLKGDEQVIVNGILRAVPGREVRPVEAKPAPSA